MSFLAVNLLLAVVWALLVGVTLANLLLGMALGFVALALADPFVGSDRYVHAAAGALRLAGAFAVELVTANMRLARDVLRARPAFEPGFIRVPIPELGDEQVALLAAMVSLTPGSVTVDVDRDGRALFVHTVYARDPDEVRRSVRALAAGIQQASAPRGER